MDHSGLVGHTICRCNYLLLYRGGRYQEGVVCLVSGATAGKRRRLLVLPGMPAAAKRPLTTSVATRLDSCSGRDIAVPWRVQQVNKYLQAARQLTLV